MSIIVVEDDPAVRALVSRTLEQVGHSVTAVESADEAVGRMDDGPRRVRLVVSDVSLPGRLDGIGLATWLAVNRPGLPVVLMSGDDAALQRARDVASVCTVLPKPFRLAELTEAVERALAGADDRALSMPHPAARLAAPHVIRPARLGPVVDVMPTMRAAAAEAMRTQHAHVGSEHIALVALEGPWGLSEIAVDAGLDPAALRPALEGCCTTSPSTAEPAITPRTARMLANAAQLALLDGRQTIESGHLVVALLAEPGAVAWRGLGGAGCTHALVLKHVTSTRRPWAGTAAEGTGRPT